MKDTAKFPDVCLKRKIRNRLMDLGASVFVQSDDRRNDGFHSLKERADACPALSAATKSKNREAYAKAACETWMDVRSFGQVFAFKDDEVSVGIRGPVSIHPAFSVDPITIDSLQITKSVNSITGSKKSSEHHGLQAPGGICALHHLRQHQLPAGGKDRIQ